MTILPCILPSSSQIRFVAETIDPLEMAKLLNVVGLCRIISPRSTEDSMVVSLEEAHWMMKNLS